MNPETKRNIKTECHVYFVFRGDFDPLDISRIMGLTPSRVWKKEDLRKDGKPFGFALWEYGYYDDYNPYLYQMMEKVIEPLWNKIKEINYIRDTYNIEPYLTVVPSIYLDEVYPAVAPSLKVMDFCHETRTHLDIDLYIYDGEDEED